MCTCFIRQAYCMLLYEGCTILSKFNINLDKTSENMLTPKLKELINNQYINLSPRPTC